MLESIRYLFGKVCANKKIAIKCDMLSVFVGQIMSSLAEQASIGHISAKANEYYLCLCVTTSTT